MTAAAESRARQVSEHDADSAAAPAVAAVAAEPNLSTGARDVARDAALWGAGVLRRAAACLAGGQSALARACGVSRQLVSDWCDEDAEKAGGPLKRLRLLPRSARLSIAVELLASVDADRYDSAETIEEELHHHHIELARVDAELLDIDMDGQRSHVEAKRVKALTTGVVARALRLDAAATRLLRATAAAPVPVFVRGVTP